MNKKSGQNGNARGRDISTVQTTGVAAIREPQRLKAITQSAPDSPGELWRFVQDSSPAFDLDCFDTDKLRSRGAIDGVAEAGRGNTVFFTLADQPLVLRHYYRGGLIRHISQSHYIFTGMQRTRALCEFDMLLHLHEASLPAPRPYACRVQRHGLFYQASLITHRLAGRTLAQRLIADGGLAMNGISDDSLWRQIGDVIACFHIAGVYHADLNAHNIMIDDDANVALLDFDRGRLRARPKVPSGPGWCLQNLNRLKRSINKIASVNAIDSWQHGFLLCQSQWREVLASIK